jgi:hypothetical protein
MENETPEFYTLTFKDGRKHRTLFDPDWLEEVGVCYVFFNWVATMEVFFSDDARASHSPHIFSALSRLTAKGYVENSEPGRWKSTRSSIQMARSYEAFNTEMKEWITERLSNGS